MNDGLRIVDSARVIDRRSWERLVVAHPDGSAFQHPGMYDAYAAAPEMKPIVVAAIDRDDQVVGVMLGAVIHTYAWPISRLTARAIVPGGPITIPGAENAVPLLLDRFEELASPCSVYTQVRNLADVTDRRSSFVRSGFEWEDHLNVLIDLTASEGVRWAALKRHRQRNIRRAEQAGVSIREVAEGSEFDRCLLLLRSLYERIKLPLPSSKFFYALHASLGDERVFRTFGAFVGSELVGFRMVLCCGPRVYDYYAAVDEGRRELQANAYLPWGIASIVAAEGYSIFDFGGAGKPGVPYGVRDFKIAYGGTVENVGRFTRVHNPRLFRCGQRALAFIRSRPLSRGKAGDVAIHR